MRGQKGLRLCECGRLCARLLAAERSTGGGPAQADPELPWVELPWIKLAWAARRKASAVELLLWLNRTGSFQDDRQQWQSWEEWFVEIEESHTSLPILSFFRSPQPGRSWVSSCGLILDTAALLFAAVDGPQPRQAQLTFKAGCLTLNRVYRFFNDKAGADAPNLLPIEESLPPGRADFDQACETLVERGLLLYTDLDAAWQRYQELRSRYASALEFMARLTMAPGTNTIH